MCGIAVVMDTHGEYAGGPTGASGRDQQGLPHWDSLGCATSRTGWAPRSNETTRDAPQSRTSRSVVTVYVHHAISDTLLTRTAGSWSVGGIRFTVKRQACLGMPVTSRETLVAGALLVR